jgi:hypothetical protein
MRNAFERFNISHLSPSSLNLWRSAPGIFALRYIAGIKDGGKAAMWRGTAVETGLAALLRGETSGEALNAAHMNFDLNAMGIIDEANEPERALIEPMLKECAKWKPPSDLNATQLRVEYFFDPVPIPVIGYLDLGFDGIDIDLKTTKAMPSAPRADHVRQVSLYRAARGRAGGLLYVTNKKHAYYEVSDEMMAEGLAELHAAALSLNNFLARCDTREDALRSLPVDWDHWSAPKTKVPLSELLLAG